LGASRRPRLGRRNHGVRVPSTWRRAFELAVPRIGELVYVAINRSAGGVDSSSTRGGILQGRVLGAERAAPSTSRKRDRAAAPWHSLDLVSRPVDLRSDTGSWSTGGEPLPGPCTCAVLLLDASAACRRVRVVFWRPEPDADGSCHFFSSHADQLAGTDQGGGRWNCWMSRAAGVRIRTATPALPSDRRPALEPPQSHGVRRQPEYASVCAARGNQRRWRSPWRPRSDPRGRAGDPGRLIRTTPMKGYHDRLAGTSMPLVHRLVRASGARDRVHAAAHGEVGEPERSAAARPRAAASTRLDAPSASRQRSRALAGVW